jgi:hypothetical protein
MRAEYDVIVTGRGSSGSIAPARVDYGFRIELMNHRTAR